MVSRSNLLRAVAPAVVALITLPGSIALAGPDDSTTTTAPPDTVQPPPSSTDPPPTTTATTTTTVAPPSGTTSTTVPTPTSTSTTIARSTTTTDATIPPTNETTTTTTTTTTVPEGPPEIVVRPDDIEYILLTIRWMESRETYDIPPNKGGASGAYQYIKKTWANYAGYPEAYLAPPWVQDERAAADVAAILRRYDNDVSVVPIIWYYPAALTNPALMDIVPKPEAGNVLTIRDYQWRWLDTLAYFMGGPLPPRLYALPPGLELLSGIPPVVPAAAAADQVSLAFPLLGPAAVAPPPPCDGDACDDANPAIVYGRKLQPVLAAADGVVTSVVFADASTGRVELTITDTAGTSYHYAGFNDDNPGTDDGAAPPALRLTALARVGRAVRAGQVIGFLGDSDRVPIVTSVAPATDITGATDGTGTDDPTTDPTTAPAEDPAASGLVTEPVWPHLRLTITALDGTPIDADGPVVQALFRQTCTVGIGPWSVPPNPAVFAAPIGVTDVPAGDLAGSWTITASGQVQATGLASLIYPTPGCLWSPPEPFGPHAGGNTVLPLGFTDHISLSAEIWIAITLGAEGVRPAASLLLRGP